MTYEEILKKTESKELSIEQAMQELSEIGYCPALLNDDDGRWAVTFDGFQTVVTGDEAQDVHANFFIEAKKWHTDIRQALIIALKDD
jgi:hypothetical protein